MKGFFSNPNNMDRLGAVGEALSALDRNSPVNLSKHRERIGARKRISDMMGNEQISSQFSPMQRQVLMGLPPQVAQQLLSKLITGGMPQYKYGTNNHPGGKALVGEAGPEVVELPKGAKVRPNPQAVLKGLPPALVQEYMTLTPEQQGEFIRRMEQDHMTPEEAIQPEGYDPREMIMDMSILRTPKQETFVPGAEYKTADMSEIKPSGVGETNTLHGAARSFQGLMKSFDDYENLFNQDNDGDGKPDGATARPGARRDALSIAHRDLQMQMKELYNLGVLNGPDLELMNQILIDPTSISGNALDFLGGNMDMEKRIPANIQQVRELMVNRTTPALQQLGIKPEDLMPKPKDLGSMSDDDLLKALQGGG